MLSKKGNCIYNKKKNIKIITSCRGVAGGSEGASAL